MTTDRFELVEHSYGKGGVKLLHVKKAGLVHEVRELEVSTRLVLSTIGDYTEGDNAAIVATDTQKNTVYLLAKKHGVTTPEAFGLLLCKHFLAKYPQVVEADITVELYPWERIVSGGRQHNHAFIYSPHSFRTAYVTQRRDGKPRVGASLSGLRILKTTRSSFVGFARDEYTTLPEAADRVFSTVVDARWEYASTYSLDYDAAWTVVRNAVLERFAGAWDVGVASPSVQMTLYDAEREVLDKVRHMSWIEMVMPNKHYFGFDFNRFPEKLTKADPNREVLQPVDKPSGVIRAKMSRSDLKSKL